MDEIPNDVMEDAISRIAVAAYGYKISVRKAAAIVAKSVMAERERAACIAEMHDHQGVIAAAIRASSSPRAEPQSSSPEPVPRS